jgi:hypothetical protein
MRREGRGDGFGSFEIREFFPCSGRIGIESSTWVVEKGLPWSD